MNPRKTRPFVPNSIPPDSFKFGLRHRIRGKLQILPVSARDLLNSNELQ